MQWNAWSGAPVDHDWEEAGVRFLALSMGCPTPRSVRERVEFLNLLVCNSVRGQCIIFQPEKRIIRGGWLGSSAAYRVHPPLHFRCEDQGDWCSSSCLRRLSIFLPMLKRALITQSINCTSARNGEDSPTISSYTLCTQTEHSFPPSPDRETRSGVPVRPQSLSSAVFSCTFTGGPLGPWTCSSTTPSSVCV